MSEEDRGGEPLQVYVDFRNGTFDYSYDSISNAFRTGRESRMTNKHNATIDDVFTFLGLAPRGTEVQLTTEAQVILQREASERLAALEKNGVGYTYPGRYLLERAG